MDNTKKEAIKNGFLQLFNTVKAYETKRESKFSVLTQTDTNNLIKLLEAGYGIEEFTKAIKEMLLNEWTIQTGNQTPSHLLRPSNFQRYLTLAETKEANAASLKSRRYGEY